VRKRNLTFFCGFSFFVGFSFCSSFFSSVFFYGMGYQKKRNQNTQRLSFCAHKAQEFQRLRLLDHTTPKMNNGHANSAVVAVLAALKSPPQKKKSRYFLSSGWARDNYSISLK